ncbi:gamma-glutamylcyclotransferase family protein [Sinosporangium siamense]|uniref:gamma-glutamylcyclotransferase family protein n=1 Tax=Sinosporangium siamense TaxID=1367973 RepID=UPI001951B5A0|nr:gamma-glutamylcyclotransferase family protein [Sinosporangium siamense]
MSAFAAREEFVIDVGKGPMPSAADNSSPDRLAEAPEALFVYGSLLFPEVLLALLDRVPVGVPTVVDGWRVAELAGHSYPVLVPASSSARGRIITGLGMDEWRVIDAFEDEFYELHRLTTTDGRVCWAYAATVPPENVTAGDWDMEYFSDHYLADFVAGSRA